MSRETDTPSSGPDGRGGAAYPSGTPPYGIPAIPDEGTGAGRPAARPEDRKTETTLTTRIRINIPGSRPIPPVVVRKPVADKEGNAAPDAEASAPSSATSTGAAEPPAEPARSTGPEGQPDGDKPASDWFAPRKSAPGKGAPGGGSANGSGAPNGSGGAAAGGPAAGSAPAAAPGPGAPGGARPGGGRPGGVVGSMNAPGGSRPGGTNGSGLPGATGGPVAPGHGGGTGSFDVTEALAGGTASGTRPGTGGGGEPGHDDLPYFPGDGPGGRNGQAGRPGRLDRGGRRGPGGPQQGPAGPTGGPVTGDGPMAPPAGPGAAAGRPHPGAAFDEQGRPGAPGGGLSDDTAILTPQQPAPEPGTPGYGVRHDNVSGHTLTSGIPVVPPGAAFNAGAPADGPLGHTPPKLPEPVSPPPASSSKPPKKKGRNKLVLLGGALVVLAGVAYGAGLLMNHSDVPKGTTVLGVDIGGGTRDEAVKKLDQALDDRLDKPLKLSVGGRTVELEPDNAGLQLDADATVGEAARSDYNPVSVIGSLFGNHRVVEPVMPVDEEKLQAALEDAAGGSGSVVEGSIKFESGKAVAVYPKAGQGIDVAEAADVVTEAYRTQVETGATAAVNVPTAPQQPKVSKAEVDRMMKEFAEPAMSGLVTVRTDAAHSIPFGPVSLPKILGVKAVGGKLVETYDLEALRKAYGSTFDGVQIEGASGKRDVQPQDVVSALRKALRGKTPAERIGVIETNPN
ncbi:hypothetical protein [Streptomyces sp. Tu 3180]|uniref:hypothetical protein n=1 Tax=Streptomyces sp. Tu 3180 TaxID=2682611 RepID=UPI00135AB971|nr:hypothetical protein [Streptomyces sp. Tu 3180]KAF3467327.1 hypothetical protein GL259_25480 [Streptomyces sp. Tu 3180]